MHVVHLANTTKNGIIASAMGVIFDVDDFFSNLKLNNEDSDN